MNAYNAYPYRRTAKRKSALARLLRAVFEVVCERICATQVRTAAVVIGFAVSLGLVGGMESGVLPLYIGLPVCLILAIAGLLMHFED